VYLYAKELHARKGVDGQHICDGHTVREVKEGRQSLRNGSHVSAALAGSVASQVFTELRAGKGTIDIVIERNILPEQVERLADMFQRMNGALVISGSQLRSLYMHPAFMGAHPCPTSDALLTGLLESLGGENVEMCVRCGKRPRQFCRACHPLGEENKSGLARNGRRRG
jgi:hypothetical protein